MKMETHSYEQLSGMKYVDLQQLAKSLNLKYGRQKTAKLIQSILQEEKRLASLEDNLDAASDEILIECTEPPNFIDETNSSTEVVPKKSTTPQDAKKKRRKRKKKTKSVDKMTPGKDGEVSKSATSDNIDTVDSENKNNVPPNTNKPRPSLTRSGTFEIIETKKYSQLSKLETVTGVDSQENNNKVSKVEQNFRKSANSRSLKTVGPNKLNPSLRRSRTFEIPSTGSPANSEKLKCRASRTSLKRSGTFEIITSGSPSKKRKRSSDDDVKESPHKTARLSSNTRGTLTKRLSTKKSPLKSPDLLCKESQSVTDIEEVENFQNIGSPSNYPKSFRHRRSLRGQLLVSRASCKVDRKGVDSEKKSLNSAVKQENPFSVSQKSPATKDTKKTGIPRFVKYALKMPNFNRIHAQNFMKMESVDEYVSRKNDKLNEAKKSVGITPKSVKKISFKPSVTSVKDVKTNFSEMPKVPLSAKENTPAQRKKPNAFAWGKNTTTSDTPGSFKRRSAYKPKTGVEATRIPISRKTKTVLKSLANKNPVVKSSGQRKHDEKNFLKGVRLNKRFELQMAKRGIKYDQSTK